MSLGDELERALSDEKIVLQTEKGEIVIVSGEGEARLVSTSPPTFSVPRQLFEKIRSAINDESKRRRVVEVLMRHLEHAKTQSGASAQGGGGESSQDGGSREEQRNLLTWRSFTLRKVADIYAETESLAKTVQVPPHVRQSVRDVLKLADEVALEAEQTHPQLVHTVDHVVQHIVTMYRRYVQLHSQRRAVPSLFISELAKIRAFLHSYRLQIQYVKNMLNRQIQQTAKQG